MIVRKANGADFYVVIGENGRIMAQGRKEMCERIAAGLPLFSGQGSLFDE